MGDGLLFVRRQTEEGASYSCAPGAGHLMDVGFHLGRRPARLLDHRRTTSSCRHAAPVGRMGGAGGRVYYHSRSGARMDSPLGERDDD